MSKDSKTESKAVKAGGETLRPADEPVKPAPMPRRWVFFSKPNGHAGFGTVVFRDSTQNLVQGPNGMEQKWSPGVRLSTSDLPSRFELPEGLVVCRELNLDKNPTYLSANPPVSDEEFMTWLKRQRAYQDGRVFTWEEYLEKVAEYNEAKAKVRAIQFSLKRVEDDKGQGAKRGSAEA